MLTEFRWDCEDPRTSQKQIDNDENIIEFLRVCNLVSQKESSWIFIQKQPIILQVPKICVYWSADCEYNPGRKDWASVKLKQIWQNCRYKCNCIFHSIEKISFAVWLSLKSEFNTLHNSVAENDDAEYEYSNIDRESTSGILNNLLIWSCEITTSIITNCKESISYRNK